MLESLNDFRATFGDTAVSPIMEEEDEENVSNASTEPVPTGDEAEVEAAGPGAGGNAAPGSAGGQVASPALATPGDSASFADPDRPAGGVTVVCIELSPEEPPVEGFEQPPPSAPEFIGANPDLRPFPEHQAFAAAPAPVLPEAPAPAQPDEPMPLVSTDTVESFNIVQGAGPLHSDPSATSPMQRGFFRTPRRRGARPGPTLTPPPPLRQVAETPPLQVVVGVSARYSPHARPLSQMSQLPGAEGRKISALNEDEMFDASFFVFRGGGLHGHHLHLRDRRCSLLWKVEY